MIIYRESIQFLYVCTIFVFDINDIQIVSRYIVFRVQLLASFRCDTWVSKIALFIQLHIRLSHRSDKITIGAGFALIFRIYHHRCPVLVHTEMTKNITHISP